MARPKKKSTRSKRKPSKAKKKPAKRKPAKKKAKRKPVKKASKAKRKSAKKPAPKAVSKPAAKTTIVKPKAVKKKPAIKLKKKKQQDDTFIPDEIAFGTDGWRAVISDTFTFKNVGLVAQAISEWVNRHLRARDGQKAVTIGYDTRFLSKEYAHHVAQILAANKITVYLSDSAVPTPALSYGVTCQNAVAGIMITASHNPYRFNGIKIKTAQGGGAGNDITDIVESYLRRSEVQSIDFDTAVKDERIIMHDYKEDYLKFLKKYLDLKAIKKSKFKVITDVMHGSGNSLMEQALEGTNVRLSLMREDVNPSFDGGKPEPIEEYVPELLERVKKEKFDLGLVLDGDADRIAAVAPGGEFVNPQRVLGLLVLHLVRNRGRHGGIVKTICGTTMLDKIAAALDLPLYETPVGFKYISDLMVSENIVAGGEEAGGIGFQDYVPERDGTLAGLLLLEMMVYQKKNLKKLLSEMEKEFGRYHYVRGDLNLPRERYNPERIAETTRILGKKVVEVKDFDGVKLICEDESWLMFRPSGTEPLVRIYAEAKSLSRAKQLLVQGEAILKRK